jgi:hypothetical protein
VETASIRVQSGEVEPNSRRAAEETSTRVPIGRLPGKIARVPIARPRGKIARVPITVRVDTVRD